MNNAARVVLRPIGNPLPLGFLALAMTGAVMLIADFIYSPTLTIISGIAAAIVYGVLWYVLPLAGPRGPSPDEAKG